jgi:UDP-N-acetyl-D-mannosaminuronate dehydrogenase
VVSARDARHAALAKLVENVFRYVDLTLANELAACFPGYDLTHALALAGSKWDMNTYHPSLGIGGYCIPLAPRYLQIEGARLPKTLEQACAVNTTHLDNQFAGPLARLARCRTIAILGLSYAPNCGIANGSLTPSYTERLKSCGCDVWVHDPYFAPKDIERHTGVGALEDPRCLADVEGIIIMTDHRAYRECALDWVSYLRRGTVVVDNFGTWRAVAAERELDYYELGRPRA